MDLRDKVITLLSKETKLSKSNVDSILEVPPDSKLGDLSFPCFSLSKKSKKSPGEIAKDLREKIVVPKGFNKIEIAGPYLNFYFGVEEYNREILTNAIKENYGSGSDKKDICMDIFQANPYKDFHIGHLRNAVLGESVRRILEFNGAKTYSISYVGDVGIHIAKWLWYFNKFYKGKIPNKNISKWAGEIYVKAIEKISENEEEYMEEVNELNKKLYNRDTTIVKTWKKIRDLCYKDADSIAEDLGVKVDKRISESEVEGIGRKKVLKLLAAKKLKKDDGAVVLNLKKYGLGVFLLLKGDGTTLYSTKDIGLVTTKKKLFKPDELIYVVGSEQELYFKQLFKTFELLGISKESQNIHISYGLVGLKEGKMSSRYGNVITYSDLRDNMIKNAFESVKKRNPKMSSKELAYTAQKIAVGAMILGMLKQSNIKPIVFDIDEVLRFEGDTGPYLQYGLVRAKKILAKAKSPSKINFSLLNSETERDLIKLIDIFPDKVLQAKDQYQPSVIANYSLELVHSFNKFYESNHVLSAEKKQKEARLLLVSAYEKVLSKCLYLLAVPEVNQM